MKSLPSLSVILPTFNESSWLVETIQRVDQELIDAHWVNAEILVVNDGSSDTTENVVRQIETSSKLRLISQENRGRFAARLTGLQQSDADYVLLIDSRVHANFGSLKFLANQMLQYPERQVWNGDVDIAQSERPPAAFWLGITRLAWRRYFKTRTLTSFDEAEFDYFPKGTTFFFAPRDLLLEACSMINSHFTDLNLVNDDTLLIKPISKTHRIYISPDFRCTYFSRDSYKKFRKHSFHRGTVFVDAYLRRGSRYLLWLFCAIFVLATATVLAFIFPLLTGLILLLLVLAPIPVLRTVQLTKKEIWGFYRALPHFVPTYAAGIARGLFLATKSRFHRASKQ
jgi:glycosyltransferase involved in cell wall biosynthesis